MIEKKTCLLLGAGASHHLGFPLGKGLKTKIEDLLTQMTTWHTSEFAKIGIQCETDYCQQFFNELAFGNWHSPDAFLEHFPEYNQLGKYLICSILASTEDRTIAARNEGWYREVIKALHVRDISEFPSNKLSVVTFNYDRSLEFRLHTYLQYHFRLSFQDAWNTVKNTVEIVHVHGLLGKYPQCEYGTQSDYLERSKDIKIVSEADGQAKEFARASHLLNEAERVIVVGFGFANDNVQRLNYFRHIQEEDRDIIVCAGSHVGTPAEKRIQQLLGQWGLIYRKHYWNYTSDLMSSHGCDLFHWD